MFIKTIFLEIHFSLHSAPLFLIFAANLRNKYVDCDVLLVTRLELLLLVIGCRVISY